MINSFQFIKTFFIFCILIISSYSQIKIPLKYYPVNNYDNSSPASRLQNIIQQELYANIEIGTPKRTIQIPLTFDSNDFYIVDISRYNDESNTNKYRDIKFYDSSSSTTFTFFEGESYDYTGDDFQLGSYTQDIFYFNNKKTEMEFYYPLAPQVSESGGIGLQLLPKSNIPDATPTIERTFLERLKKKNLIQNYYWTIFYNSKGYKKEEEGFILLGCLPHTLDEDLGYYKKGYFNEELKRKVNMPNLNPNIENSFDIDLMYAYKGNDKNKTIEDFPFGYTDYKRIILDYNSGGVRAPYSLKKYFDRVFEEFIINERCSNITVGTWNPFTFYYCDNDKNVISKIKSNFPGINFRSHDLDTNFTIEADDLFVEENEYVFCLLYFQTNTGKNWVMGKPFLKKYSFTINHEEKYISFYHNNTVEESEKDESSKSKISTTVFVLVICGTILFVLIIFFVIFKFYLFEKFFRKARTNELKDDEYDYTAKNEDKNVLNIN